MQQYTRCEAGPLRSIKLHLGILFFSSVALWAPLWAGTAIVECTADTYIAAKNQKAADGRASELKLPEVILLNFRFDAIRDWSVSKATLLLHVVNGKAPTRLEIAIAPNPWREMEVPHLDWEKWKYLSHFAEAQPEDWVTVDVAAPLIELLAAGKGHGLALREKVVGRERIFHSRQSGHFAPYLIVEGQPMEKR
jgi:hypothetical protein